MGVVAVSHRIRYKTRDSGILLNIAKIRAGVWKSPIASVGLSEKQAREQGIKFRMQKENTYDWYTARSVGESTYGFKVLIENGTDRVLGAHLIGPHADEVINVFAMAIRNDLTTRQLEDTVFAYPTAASDVHYMI
jgi:glutathione reductase (NADPH)